MEEENKIYIGNIDYEVTEEELREIFKEKGFEVKDVNIIRDNFPVDQRDLDLQNSRMMSKSKKP